MALSIKNPDADRLARELALVTGESLTEAIVVSLRERLARETAGKSADSLRDKILEIGRRSARHSTSDGRSADEIMGYDQHGLPG